jgi:hypothetical protein
MATIINNPGENSGNGTSGGAGVVIGAVLVILVLVIAIVLALPYIRRQVAAMRSPGNPTINVQLPSTPILNNTGSPK